MTNPSVHSEVSIHIVLAFLEFLSSVENSIGVEEHEKLKNIKESLVAFFNINPSMLEATGPNVSEEQNASTSKASDNAPLRRLTSTGSNVKIGMSLAFLFHEFHMAVAALGFFDSAFGQDYETRKYRAKHIFKEAIAVLMETGRSTFDRTNLADGLKMLGNKAMQKEWYETAIEMYSCAIALFKDNAVFFCNRAAALTKFGRFEDAIRDCYEAIKLKEGYVMPYYRIGCAYYEQGKNLEAIRLGFLKVLELDPQNQDAMVSIQLAESKLKGEVASLSDQIGSLSLDGAPPMTENQASGRESTVLVFRGPEGENGPWELVEETKEDGGNDGDEEDTVTVADFIDTHVRKIHPPE